MLLVVHRIVQKSEVEFGHTKLVLSAEFGVLREKLASDPGLSTHYSGLVRQPTLFLFTEVRAR